MIDKIHMFDTISFLDQFIGSHEDPGFTMPALAKKMNVSRKTIANYLKTLKEKGVVVRVGGRKEGYWKINNK